MKATAIRRGHVILIDKQPVRVMEFTHRTPGNLRAFVQLRLRNLLTGNTFDTRVSATDFLDEARIDTKEFQVVYRDSGGVHVMDTQTYEQLHVPGDAIGAAKDYLLENASATVALHEGVALYVELPASVELTITYTEPGVQGDRSTGGNKPATLETGATVQVPLFISQGEKIKVDTRDGRYLGRVNS